MAQILLLCGSLRRQSLNRLLLECAAAMAPSEHHCAHFELNGLPLYDEDADRGAPPAAAVALRTALAEAAGVIVATPEYNYGLPGVLKNAFDWASRPRGRAPLSGKVAMALVATSGATSGHEGSAQLRACLSNLQNFVLTQPVVVVPRAHKVLSRDAHGVAHLADAEGQRLLAANWQAMQAALAADAGALCLVGAAAYAAAGRG